jgi:hypothetical protein
MSSVSWKLIWILNFLVVTIQSFSDHSIFERDKIPATSELVPDVPKPLPDYEYNALFDLYYSTNGPEWSWLNISNIPWNFTNPSHAAPCEDNWQGVTCVCSGKDPCHVTELLLSEHNISGRLPQSIGALNHSTKLNFFRNNLTTPIPSSLTNISTLIYLDLHTNLFIGTIPEFLGEIYSLSHLDLSDNFFTGTIPENFYSLKNFTIFQMSYNHLHGTISPSIGQLSNLSAFSIVMNYFTGSIPSTIGNCQKLQELIGSYNFLNSTLPYEFWHLPLLGVLDLSANHLSGTFPEDTYLPSMLFFYLYYNSFYGKIPDSFFSSNMYRMRSVDLDDNLFSGPLSENIALWNNSLQSLYLGNCSFTGKIPEALSNLTHLTVLELNINFMLGDDFYNKFSNLNFTAYLDISTNLFSGPLPEGLSTFLTFYLAHNNYFAGTMPIEYTNSLFLYYFDISANYISDSMPSWFMKSNELVYFNISNNFYYGKINGSVGSLTTLHQLSLANNEFSGTLPPEIGNIKTLENLLLNNNQFTGTIPDSFLDIFDLSILFLRNNYLTGTLSNQFIGLPKITNIDISSNQLTGPLPNVFDNTIISDKLETFAATSNCFSGSIPPSICQVTSLVALALDGLSSADECKIPIFESAFFLTGYVLRRFFENGIPDCLFSMPNLETLHLSGNGITGCLTEGLVITPTLKDLSLSHNQLTGTIPAVFQERVWTNLDLSYNRFNGELRLHNFLENASSTEATVSLEINRLSGNIPGNLLSFENVNILDGNLFTCDFNHGNLPTNDPKKDDYSCGSDLVNSALYIWIGVFTIIFGFFLMIVVYERHYSHQESLRRKKRRTVSKDGIELRPTLTDAMRATGMSDEKRDSGVDDDIEGRSSEKAATITTITDVKQLNVFLLLFDFIQQLFIWRNTFLDEMQLKKEFVIDSDAGANKESFHLRNRTTSDFIGTPQASSLHQRLPSTVGRNHSLCVINNHNSVFHNYQDDSSPPHEKDSPTTMDDNVSNENTSENLPVKVTATSINWDSLNSNSLIHLNIFLRNIRRLFAFLTLILVIFYVPIYLVSSSFYRSYEQSYVWILSGLVLNGQNAGIILLVLFLFILLLFIVLFKLLLSYMILIEDGKYDYTDLKRRVSNDTVPLTSSDSLPNNDAKARSRTESAETVSSNRRTNSMDTTNYKRHLSMNSTASKELRRVSYINKLSLFIVGLGNFILMILADIFYVYVVVNESTIAIIFAEIFLAIFKITLNNSVLWMAIPFTRKLLLKWALPASSASSDEKKSGRKQSSASTNSKNNDDNVMPETILPNITPTNSEENANPAQNNDGKDQKDGTKRETINGKFDASRETINDEESEEEEQEELTEMEKEMLFYHYSTEDLSFLSFMILLNNLIFPAIAILTVNTDCFYYVIFAAPDVSSSYTYTVCERTDVVFQSCLKYVETVETTSYTPPFIYSYQCASHIFTNYASVFILMAIFEGVIQPFFKLSLRFYYDYVNLLIALRKEEELRAQKHSEFLSKISLSYLQDVESMSNGTNSKHSKSLVSSSANNNSRNSKRNTTSTRSFASSSHRPSHIQAQAQFKKGWLIHLLPFNLRDLHSKMNGTQKETLILFDKNRLSVRIASYLMVFCTFGVLFPPIAVVICLSVFSITIYEEIIVGRLLYKSFQLKYFWYKTQLQKNCYGIVNSLKYNLWSVVPVTSILYAYILFDTWSTETGWNTALRPTLVVILLPTFILLLIACYPYFLRMWKYLTKRSTDQQQQRGRSGESVRSRKRNVTVDEGGQRHESDLESKEPSDHSDSKEGGGEDDNGTADDLTMTGNNSSLYRTSHSLSVSLETMIFLPRSHWPTSMEQNNNSNANIRRSSVSNYNLRMTRTSQAPPLSTIQNPLFHNNPGMASHRPTEVIEQETKGKTEVEEEC